MLLKQHFVAHVERVPFSNVYWLRKGQFSRKLYSLDVFILELRDLFLESPGPKAIFSNQNLKYREAGLGP